MPRLNGICWYPDTTDSRENHPRDSKVYRVRQTGEIFYTYEDYLERLRLLHSRQWSSQINGRSGLNYEEALHEDNTADALAPKFPQELEEAALRATHHSSLSLEELVTEIQSLQSSPGNSGKENLPEEANGREPEEHKPAASSVEAISPESIRCWLLKAADLQRLGSRGVWVAKPAYRLRFKLAEPVPAGNKKFKGMTPIHLQANGSSERGMPSKKSPGKRKSPADREEYGITGNKKQKPPKPAFSAENESREVAPPARTLQEEEQRLKPGTHKFVMFQVLKTATTEGMTIRDIMNRAVEMGHNKFEEAQKSSISAALTTDPTFVRVKKGCYALRCCMGNAPYESVGGRSRKPKPAADTPLLGPAAQHIKPKSIVDNKASLALDSKPQASPEAVAAPKKDKENANGVNEQEPEPPLRTVEEEEERLKPSTKKGIIFRVLRSVGSAGMEISQIVEAAQQHEDWTTIEADKKATTKILCKDSAFVRISKGVYALRALMGDLPFESMGGQNPSKPPQKQQKAATGDVKPLRPSTPTQPSHVEQEVESLPKAEQVEVQVRKAVEAHTHALQKALTAEAKAKARVAASSHEPKTPSKPPLSPNKLGPKPSLELSQEQLTFKGDSNNAEDTAAHEKRVAGLKAEQVERVKAWERQHAELSGQKEQARALRQLKSAQKKVSTCRQDVESACLALKEAVKAADKDKAKRAAAEKKAEEKKAREEARLIERERKKAETLEAKRYPMEDLQLLQELSAKAKSEGGAQPAGDVPLPSEMYSQQDSAATAEVLFVADLIAQFSKPLKLKAVPFQELLRLTKGEVSPTAASQEVFWDLYMGILSQIDQASDENDEECLKDRPKLLNRGTLTEALAQYLRQRSRASPHLLTIPVAAAAEALERSELDELTGSQHQALLSFLCNDILEGERLRDVLQARLEDSGEVKREMREAVAEKRGELKEILDAEKEERKRRREEERASKKAKESQKLPQEDAPADDHTAAKAEPAAELEEAPSGSADHTDGEDAEQEEPSWVLPEELQEFKGDADDRKGMLAFRQKQQSARQKLDREKEKWHKQAQIREKLREAKLKKLAEAENAKAKAKAAAEEEVLRKQEELERELEKYSLRRAPLGFDRRYRAYWWGLAGERSAVYVQDDDGRLHVLASPEELAALMAGLDKRGVRELALSESLEKAYPAITQAMRRALAESKGSGTTQSKAQSAAQLKEAIDRFPKRQRVQATFFDPTKQNLAESKTTETAIKGLAAASVESAVASLEELQEGMVGWGIPPPSEGWTAWSQNIKDVLRQAQEPPTTDGFLKTGSAILKTCLLAAEEMLQAAAQQNEEATPGNVREDKERSQDPESEEAADVNGLWGKQSKSAAWIQAVTEAKTLAALALASGQLTIAGSNLLSKLKKPKSKAKGRSANSKATKAPPSDAKVSRTAAMEKTEKEETAARKAGRIDQAVREKKKSKQAPQQLRVTRSSVR